MNNSEINTRMAEFMGWKEIWNYPNAIVEVQRGDEIIKYRIGSLNFCENISDAWMLVEKLMKDGHSITLSMSHDEGLVPFGVYLDNKFKGSESAPMAICLAVLELGE